MRNEECLIVKWKPGVLLFTDQHQYFPILFLILKLSFSNSNCLNLNNGVSIYGSIYMRERVLIGG